jgi:outer membrane receptor protein involved in Fe transport
VFTRITILALLALSLPFTAPAQIQSRITGTVTDATGAAVVGATLNARNTETGVVTNAVSNDNGVYSIPFLIPGPYEITAEMQGFKKFVRSGIVLETGTVSTVDVRLDLGNLTETVQVDARAPLLESESSSVGQLIENSSIRNLPIQSRRGAALVRLMGNVTFTSEDGGEAVPKFSMAGGRSQNQMWHLDGGVTQNMALGVAQLALNPPNEALQEFKAVANNYSAEYGRTGGGLVVMTTRSGTNAFHGAVYEWLRNDALNARTFFSPDKPPLRYNIFGGSIGGPVIRNKTFFFFNYEGGRRRTGVTQVRTVPNPAEINGDFSARTDVRILDPATRQGNTPAQPFPGNRIPANRIDRVGAALAALYPAPNTNINPARQPANNFRANTVDRLDQDFYTARVDHTLTSKDRIFGRLAYALAPETIGAVFPNDVADERAGTRENATMNLLGNWQRTITPSVINEFRYMYSWRKHVNKGAGTGSDFNQKLNIPGVEPTALPRVTLTGYASLGQAPHLRIQDPILTHQVTDNLLLVRGNHQIKTGFEFRYSANGDILNQSYGGLFNFTDRATNNGLASLLLGWTNNAALVQTDPLNTRTDYYGVYVQDDWKVSSRLTLNLGVRWEVDTPRWENSNRQSGFDGTQINPVSGTPGVVTFAGLNGVGKYAHDFDWNNIGPRLGFAWRVRNSLVVRGGYGIAYNGAYQGAVPNVFNQGFSLNGTFQSPDAGFTQAFPLSSGIPAIPRVELTPGYGAVPVGSAVRTSPDFMERPHENGYAQQWNFTVQKELPGNMIIESAYIANVGHKLGGPNVNINQIPLVNGRGPAVADQRLRPYPQFANVTRVSPDWGNSTYHSLNLKVEKRYSSGLNFLTNYTWSKFIDDIESGSELGGSAGNGYQHIELRRDNKGLSGSDIRHRIVGSVVYELPFGRGRRVAFGNSFVDAVFGGWSIGSIIEARTGSPYGVIEQTNRLNTFSDSQRPNVLRNPEITGDRTRGEMLARYFDTSAFVAPGDGVPGNAGRTQGFGPGFFNLDASLNKRFRLTERLSFILRSDIVNILNHPNFGLPNLSRGNAAFGTINSIAPGSSGREIQINARIEF